MKKAIDSQFLVYIGTVGILASALMFWITAHGPDVTIDSTIYFHTAKSLLTGNGFHNAFPNYPPGYPLLLAAAGALDNNITHASRLLDAFFFGANAVLIAFAIYMYTGRSVTAVMCAVLWFLTSKDMLYLHSMAGSEPPFLGFSLAAFILFSKHIVSPRFSLLVWASIFLSLAIVTRYAGVTLLPPIIACVLFLGNRPIRHRIRDGVIIGAIGCAPLAIWLLRNIVVAQTATGRNFAVHPITVSQIKSLIVVVHDMFLPIPVPGWMKVFQLGLLLALFIAAVAVQRVGYRQGGREHDVATVSQFLSILFCVTYVAFLLVFVSFIDVDVALSWRRIVTPLFVFLLLAIISWCWNVAKITNKPLVWYGFLIFWFLSVTTNGAHAIKLAATIHGEGRGYEASIWTNSDSIRFVQLLPDQMTIYSNGPELIWFLTDKEAVLIPATVNRHTLIPNHDFEEGMKTMCRVLTQQRAVLVYFKNIHRSNLPTEEELESDFGLSVRVRFTDGTVYEKLNN